MPEANATPRAPRTCAYAPCSCTFQALPKQRYCSRAHKERARQQRKEQVGKPGTCAWCGSRFSRTSSAQRYCHDGCRWAAGRMNSAQWHLASSDPRSHFDLRYGLITDTRTRRNRMEAEYQRAMLRDPCAYCGAPSEQLDHIVPRHDGGKDRDNLAPACGACNAGKRALPMLHFLLAEHIKRLIAQDTRDVLTLRGATDRQGRLHVARAA